MATWDDFINYKPPQPSSSAPDTPVAQPQQPNWNQDYSSQLDQMIAPYRQMAQQTYSPYATMSPNSWLARNHPGLAGHLDNMLLTLGSMGPTGATAGENISNVARGLTGAQQWHRQNMLQASMLPYEMAKPQLAMEDQMAQMRQRQAMTQADLARIPVDQSIQLRNIGAYEKYMNPQPNAEQQKMHLAGVASGAIQDPNMTADQAKAMTASLMEQTRQANRATPGGLLGEILDNQLSDDPAKRELGKRQGQLYTTLTGQQAGARAGATKGADQPFVNVDDEAKAAQSEFSMQKPMTQEQFEKAHEMDPTYMSQSLTVGPDKLYQGYLKDAQSTYDRAKSGHDAMVANYRRAAAKNPSLTWFDYKTGQTGGGPTSGGPDASAPPPRNPFRSQ